MSALPGSKQNDEVGDRSFAVTQGEILGFGFMDRASSVVLLLTCGRGQCTAEEMAMELGKKIQEHMDRLPEAPPEVTEDSEDGAAAAPDPASEDDSKAEEEDED